MSIMIERLEGMVNRYHEITEMMMMPEIVSISTETTFFFSFSTGTFFGASFEKLPSLLSSAYTLVTSFPIMI